MFSSPLQSSGFFTPSRITHRDGANHAEIPAHARAMALHVAGSTWAGAAQALKLVGVSIVLVPMAPIGLMMWLAKGMQDGRGSAN